MDQTGELERLIGPVVTGLGYELVRLMVKSGRQATLQIMVERADRRAMLVDDCARVSREISVLLDTADPIEGEYTLEVSSPGIDRPLMNRADYERFAGHEVRLEIEPPIDDRKRFQGTIAAIEGDDVRLATPTGEVLLPFSSIQRAKLVLTDRLISAALKEAGPAEESEAASHAA